MSDEQKPLVSISDVLGIGAIANSKAAENLISGVVSGVGRLFDPYLLKREARARLQIQQEASKLLSPRFDGSMELFDRASLRLNFEAGMHQDNREAISALAIEKFKDSGSSSKSDVSIECDWLSYFWRCAETVSNEKMQEIWARVLAREAQTPGVTSLRTLDVIRSFSFREAKEIERLAKFSFSLVDPENDRSTYNSGFLQNLSFKDFPIASFLNTKQVKDELNSVLLDPHLDMTFGGAGLWTVDGWGRGFYARPSRGLVTCYVGRTRLEVSGFWEAGELAEQTFYFGGGRGFSSIGSEIFKLADVDGDAEFIRELVEKLEARNLAVCVT